MLTGQRCFTNGRTSFTSFFVHVTIKNRHKGALSAGIYSSASSFCRVCVFFGLGMLNSGAVEPSARDRWLLIPVNAPGNKYLVMIV